MWVITFLTTEAITRKPQTWKEVFRECGMQGLEATEELTLNTLWDAGVSEYRTRIEEISYKAEKQWGIEKKLNELVERLKEVRVEFMSYGKSGTHVLKSVDEV